MTAILAWFQAHPAVAVAIAGGVILVFFSRSLIWLVVLAGGALLYATVWNQ